MSLLVAGLVAGAVSALANGIGSVAASHAAKQAADAQKLAIDRKEQKLENWHDRIMNEDATQTASAQQSITRLREELRRQNQAVAGSQAVMGGTNAAAAAQKEQSSKAMAETMSNIAAAADAKKERADEMYMEGSSNIADQRAQLDAQKYATQGQAAQTAAQGVGQAAGAFLNAYAMGNGGGTATEKALGLTGK